MIRIWQYTREKDYILLIDAPELSIYSGLRQI